jgi:hypothetical protein
LFIEKFKIKVKCIESAASLTNTRELMNIRMNALIYLVAMENVLDEKV